MKKPFKELLEELLNESVHQQSEDTGKVNQEFDCFQTNQILNIKGVK